MSVTLKKWGNSHAIRVPKAIINQLNWTHNQKLRLLITENRLTLQPVEENTIEALFANFKDTINDTELDWGITQGEEY